MYKGLLAFFANETFQVTMNPDGTIAGAHGINLTDNSGRLIPVSLSLSLPISSFANSMATSNSNDSIATSEAAAAASAVHEIFSNQPSEPTIDVQLSTGQVITEPIENPDLIKDDHAGEALINFLTRGRLSRTRCGAKPFSLT